MDCTITVIDGHSSYKQNHTNRMHKKGAIRTDSQNPLLVHDCEV